MPTVQSRNDYKSVVRLLCNDTERYTLLQSAIHLSLNLSDVFSAFLTPDVTTRLAESAPALVSMTRITKCILCSVQIPLKCE